MKKIMILFISLMVLGACSNDDNAPVNSEVTHENQIYPLDQALYSSFESAFTYFEITDSQGGEHLVRVIFKQIDAMPDGTYTMHSTEDPDYDPEIHFAGGALYPSFAVAPISFASGTVKFSRSGANYKIVFDIETTQGSLNGTFIGPVSEQ